MPSKLTRPNPPCPNPSLSARAKGSHSSVIRDLLALADQPHMLSMAGGLPAPELLPLERIADAATRVIGKRALQYGPTEGLSELREILSARSITATEGSTIITTGSQQGLDLVARALLDHGDVVVVESPSYLGSLQNLKLNGAVLHPIESDEEGMRVDLLEVDLSAGLRPKMLSIVPDFANPTGATLSLERRVLLASLADRYGFVIVSDSPYCELRWRGSALPELESMSDSVVSLGSASKIISPGLRIGWLSGPNWLVDAVVRIKQATDLHTSGFDQLLIADLLSDTAFMETHLASVRKHYRSRCELAATALVRSETVDLTRPDGGMFLWGRLRTGVDTATLMPAAISAGVAYVPGNAFAPTAEPDPLISASFRLCFATLGPEKLIEAIGRLVDVLRQQ